MTTVSCAATTATTAAAAESTATAAAESTATTSQEQHFALSIYPPFPVLVEGPDQLGAVVQADGVAVGAGEVALAVADGHDGGGLAHPDRLPALARLRRPQANALRAQNIHVMLSILGVYSLKMKGAHERFQRGSKALFSPRRTVQGRLSIQLGKSAFSNLPSYASVSKLVFYAQSTGTVISGRFFYFIFT